MVNLFHSVFFILQTCGKIGSLNLNNSANNMIRNSLKLNHGTFEYYLLQIAMNTKLDEIKDKFFHFKSFETDNKNVILDFDCGFDFNQLSNLLVDIDDAAKLNGITIHSIVENGSIKADSIFSIPVIDLPKANKGQNHIYNKAVIVDEPVRSGMTIENDGDIIVTTFVSDNAEIIASGNIHIYGEARGRLIAGANGNKLSRIFTQSFNPELIAIGGVYRALDSKLPANIMYQSVMVSLDEKDRLAIIPLSK